jgi:hypothetical protein
MSFEEKTVSKVPTPFANPEEAKKTVPFRCLVYRLHVDSGLPIQVYKKNLAPAIDAVNWPVLLQMRLDVFPISVQIDLRGAIAYKLSDFNRDEITCHLCLIHKKDSARVASQKLMGSRGESFSCVQHRAATFRYSSVSLHQPRKGYAKGGRQTMTFRSFPR